MRFGRRLERVEGIREVHEVNENRSLFDLKFDLEHGIVSVNDRPLDLDGDKIRKKAEIEEEIKNSEFTLGTDEDPKEISIGPWQHSGITIEGTGCDFMYLNRCREIAEMNGISTVDGNTRLVQIVIGGEHNIFGKCINDVHHTINDDELMISCAETTAYVPMELIENMVEGEMYTIYVPAELTSWKCGNKKIKLKVRVRAHAKYDNFENVVKMIKEER